MEHTDGEKKYWKYASEAQYNRKYGEFFNDPQIKQEWKLILRWGKPMKDMVSLEAGCGGGYFVKKVAGLVKKSIGVDFEKGMIRKSKKLCIDTKNTQFFKADIRKLPFKNNMFDIIMCFGVVEHFDDSVEALIELKRVLKKGGALIVSVPSAYNFTNRILRRVSILRKKRPGYFQKHYTIGSYRKLLVDAGLKIEKISGIADGFWHIPTRTGILKPLLNIPVKIIQPIFMDLQDKESSFVPYLSHMIIAKCTY